MVLYDWDDDVVGGFNLVVMIEEELLKIKLFLLLSCCLLFELFVGSIKLGVEVMIKIFFLIEYSKIFFDDLDFQLGGGGICLFC